MESIREPLRARGAGLGGGKSSIGRKSSVNRSCNAHVARSISHTIDPAIIDHDRDARLVLSCRRNRTIAQTTPVATIALAAVRQVVLASWGGYRDDSGGAGFGAA